MLYISLLCMRFFLAFRKYTKVKIWNWKWKRKICVIKIAMQKKVKCQTVVGLWCLFERDLKRLANCEVNAPETRAASLPGLLEQAWLCSTEHNETFFLENNFHFKAKEIIFVQYTSQIKKSKRLYLCNTWVKKKSKRSPPALGHSPAVAIALH